MFCIIGDNLEIGEVVLAILAVVIGAFFTSLFLILKEKKDIRRLVIRYIEVIIFVAPASLLVLLGETRLKNILWYSYNNVEIFSIVIPLILYAFGFAIIGKMVFEVLDALKEDDKSKGNIPEKVKKGKAKQDPRKGDKKK